MSYNRGNVVSLGAVVCVLSVSRASDGVIAAYYGAHSLFVATDLDGFVMQQSIVALCHSVLITLSGTLCIAVGWRAWLRPHQHAGQVLIYFSLGAIALAEALNIAFAIRQHYFEEAMLSRIVKLPGELPRVVLSVAPSAATLMVCGLVTCLLSASRDHLSEPGGNS